MKQKWAHTCVKKARKDDIIVRGALVGHSPKYNDHGTHWSEYEIAHSS